MGGEALLSNPGVHDVAPGIQRVTRHPFLWGTALWAISHLAVNGTAADVIKQAMVEIDAELDARRLRAQMILQVHDELVFEVEPSALEALTELVVDRMQGVVELSVPLEVHVGADAKLAEGRLLERLRHGIEGERPLPARRHGEAHAVHRHAVPDPQILHELRRPHHQPHAAALGAQLLDATQDLDDAREHAFPQPADCRSSTSRSSRSRTTS